MANPAYYNSSRSVTYGLFHDTYFDDACEEIGVPYRPTYDVTYFDTDPVIKDLAAKNYVLILENPKKFQTLFYMAVAEKKISDELYCEVSPQKDHSIKVRGAGLRRNLDDHIIKKIQPIFLNAFSEKTAVDADACLSHDRDDPVNRFIQPCLPLLARYVQLNLKLPEQARVVIPV